MRKNLFYKILSICLVLAIMVSLIPASTAIAAPAEKGIEVDTKNRSSMESMISQENTEIVGTNSVGNLISNTLQKEELDVSGTCFISQADIEGKIATVEYQTDRESELVVAIYTEDGVQMLSSGHVLVSSEDTIAVVEIETDAMPEYFLAKVYLLDVETHEPLSKEHIVRLYTQEMQEFLNKTVEDFSQDMVLNLDEDKTTNFAVYGEETVIIEEAEAGKKNHVQENGDGTYTITNADSLVTNLKEGNSLAYECADGSVLAVKIAKVTVKGSTVTIQEDTQAELADIFDYVKIENDGTDNEVTVDNSNLEEGVIPIEEVAETTLNQSIQNIGTSLYPSFIQVKQKESIPKIGERAISITADISKKIDKTFYEIKDEWGDDNPGNFGKQSIKKSLKGSVEGKVGFGVTGSVKIYINKNTQYVELRVCANASFNVEFVGEADIKVPVGEFTIPICTGVYISCTPCLVFGFKAQISIDVDLNTSLYYTWDAEYGFDGGYQAPQLKNNTGVSFEGNLNLGVSFEPKLIILKENIASTSMNASYIIKMVIEEQITKENAEIIKNNPRLFTAMP